MIKLPACGLLMSSVFGSFQVMHIAAAVEINSRFIPSLKQLHTSLHSKVELDLIFAF